MLHNCEHFFIIVYIHGIKCVLKYNVHTMCVFVFIQLKERLLLSHLLDERKHLIAGSSCRDKEGLKNSLDVLVGMLLGTEEETQPISMMNS